MTKARVDQVVALRAAGPLDLTTPSVQALLSEAIAYFNTDVLGPRRVRIRARPGSGHFERTVEVVMIASSVKNRLYSGGRLAAAMMGVADRHSR